MFSCVRLSASADVDSRRMSRIAKQKCDDQADWYNKTCVILLFNRLQTACSRPGPPQLSLDPLRRPSRPDGEVGIKLRPLPPVSQVCPIPARSTCQQAHMVASAGSCSLEQRRHCTPALHAALHSNQRQRSGLASSACGERSCYSPGSPGDRGDVQLLPAAQLPMC